MKKFRDLYLLLFLLGSSTNLYALENNPYLDGKEFFNKGLCRKSIESLEIFLDNRSLMQNTKEIAEAYKMLAICYLQEQNIAAATKEIEALLFLDPNTKMDPFSTPPAVLDLFNSAQKRIEKKQVELTVASESFAPKKWVPLFIPLGYPQLLKGRTTAALSLAIAEVAAVGVNIGAYWWKKSMTLPNNPSLVSSSEQSSLYSTAQTIQFVALGSAIALYVYGVLDAFFIKSASLV